MSKWSDMDTFTFLDLYQRHECLWNTKIESYKNHTARTLAIEKIIEEFGKPDFSIYDVKTKIKSIRTAYSRELAKIKQSAMSGTSLEELYKPHLIWFEKADSFLRIVTETRSHKSLNLAAGNDLHTVEDGPSLEETEDKVDTSLHSSSPLHYRNSQAHDPTPPIMKASKECQTKKRRPNIRPMEKSVHQPEFVTTRNGEDEFDSFGKNVASQLRQLPISRALLTQQKIMSVLTIERILHIQESQNPSSASSCSTPLSEAAFSHGDWRAHQAADFLGVAKDAEDRDIHPQYK